jgi:hypothetical protein
MKPWPSGNEFQQRKGVEVPNPGFANFNSGFPGEKPFSVLT